MASAQPTPATLAQNTYALDKLLADIKSRVGLFLGNEKIVFDGKTRLDAVLGSGASSPVKVSAQALKAKADALLKIQKDAEASAQALIGRAGDLKTQMETNPLYSFLSTSPTYWGLRQYQLIGNLLVLVTAMLPEGTALTARLLKQNADVKIFANEVQSVENAATGQGALPKIQGVISGVLGSTVSSLSGLLWPLAITAAVGAGLYIVAPGLLRGRR